MNTKQKALAALLALAGGAASAASVQLNVTNVPISPVGANSAVISVNFTGDGATLGVGGRMNFDFVNFQLINVTNGTATCSVNNANGRLAFNLGSANPLTNQTLCTFQVDHIGAAPITAAYTFSNMTYTGGTGSETSGDFVVSNGPPTAPTIGYSPTTLNFPAGTAIPQNQDLNVTLTATGGVNGGATSVSCSTSSPGFSIPTSASACTDTTCATNPLVFRCVSSNAAQTGTATCAATPTNPAGAAVNTTINLNCPAANVAPSLAYNPTASTPITMPQVGQGQTASSSIAVTPSAGSGTSTSTVSGCAFSAVTGATFNVTSGTLTFTGSGTAAQNIGFTCVAPTNGQPDGTATLTCAQTIGGGAPTNVSWPVTCPDGLPVAAPNVTYTPAGGTTITFAAGAAIGASVPGSTSVAVDINGGAVGGGAGPEQTSVSCTATAGFTVTGGSVGPIPAVATVGTDTTVNVSCTSAASAQAGTLTCAASQVIDGGAPTVTNTTYPLDCAAAEVNITSTPAEGAITVTGTPNTNVAGSINLANSGSDSTLSCTSTGSVTLGAVPATVPAGSSAAVPFTCLTGAPGVSNAGTIQCTTDDLGAEGTLDYTVSCIGVSDVPVPAINNLGKVLMVVLVIGLGLVGLGARRQ
ncbi:MAG TPA: hypothetical protein PLB00_01040 [Pseudomonadota bacterium]|nr:hypothetical protein [Pseudomonadota bacterium]